MTEEKPNNGEPSLIRFGMCVGLSIVLGLIALIAPFFALFGLFKPEERALAEWFMRSGSIMTIFSFLAQQQASLAIEIISPRGHGSLLINELRRKWLGILSGINSYIALVTIIGAFIWGYGDLLPIF